MSVVLLPARNVRQLAALSAVTWGLAFIVPWPILALLYSLGLDTGDMDAYVFVSSPAFVGGVLQALVLRGTYPSLTRPAAVGYALCWVLGGVTALCFLVLTPELLALFGVMIGGLLGAVAASVWLKVALPERSWEDTLWAIGGWIAGWGMGLGSLLCGACFTLFAGLEDNPVIGFFGFAVMGTIAGAVGAGALEWPDNGRSNATAPEAASKR